MKLILPTLFLALAGVASAQYATPTREVDVPAKQAFHVRYYCQNVVSSGSCQANKQVPTGMIAVIEHVSAQFTTSSQTAATYEPHIGIGSFLNNESERFYYTSKEINPPDSLLRLHIFSATTKLYTESFGTILLFHGYSSSTNIFSVTMNGYYVKK